MTTLEPGMKAPAFRALAVGGTYGDAGKEVSLGEFAGQNVVLYFYPKDDTPGCTMQACGLRDAWSEVSEKCVLFGVSIDPAKSHAKFIAKHSLPFPLLVDEGHAMVEAFGVWVEKSLYGRKYMGTERTTFIIGPDGTLHAVLRKVKPGDHATAVLEALK